jgi:hypothetical protein
MVEASSFVMPRKIAQCLDHHNDEMRISNMTPASSETLSRAADADIAAFKRIAARERAQAVRAVARRLTGWLWSGVELHYSDDALSHPAAGKLCGC